MPAPLSHLVGSIFIFETGSYVPWVVLRFMTVLLPQTFKYWSLNKPVQKLYLSCKQNSSPTLNTVYCVFITFEHAVWFINVLDLFIGYYFVYILYVVDMSIKTVLFLSKFIVVCEPDRTRLAVATSWCLNTCWQMCYFQVCLCLRCNSQLLHCLWSESIYKSSEPQRTVFRVCTMLFIDECLQTIMQGSYLAFTGCISSLSHPSVRPAGKVM